MQGKYWIILVGAALIALPVLVTPAGWMLAAGLVALWLVLTLAGPWAVREVFDLKKSRESGMKAKQVSDRLAGSDDERYRR
ncbi:MULTISPECIES: hypothetical protein [Salinibaculum]|uniref:hypothetical protein n=1 Tax=Salinibaculum TaxID=2732368 RepID=UPI0030CF1DBA